jgi:hypothetical protein
MSERCEPVIPDFPIHAEGFYRTWVVVLPYPRASLVEMMPGRLELAPQTMTPAETHPLVLLFGHHFDVRPNFLPFGGMTYHELVTAIPFVRWRDAGRDDYRGPFAYLPRLFLDEVLPTALGYLYAYPKEIARIHGGRRYTIRSLVKDRSILSGTFTPHGAERAPADEPNFEDVRPIFEMPFVGRYAPLGPYACSNLDFELERGELRPCTARVRIERPYLPGLSAGSYRLDGIDEAPLGAFELAVPWTLTPPFACGCISCA